jgi:hypothetical protein
VNLLLRIKILRRLKKNNIIILERVKRSINIWNIYLEEYVFNLREIGKYLIS